MKHGKWGKIPFRISTFVSSLMALLYIGVCSLFAADAAGVKDAAVKANMYFGSCTGTNPATSSFVNRIKSDYNMLVCENAMKWDATERTQGKFSFSGGDQVLNFCNANGMKMRGHTLVWHAQTPSWVGNLSRDQMLKAMKTHIDTVMGHFKGKIFEWDVVNEAVSAGNNSMWQKGIGTGFIDSAFVYAHKADPDAFLYYNDYGSEGMGGKSDQIYNMVKTMKSKGIPIHGVGLQCHVGSNVSKSQVSQNIKRLGELGLRVSLTEIDIKPTSAQAWANLVGAAVENFNATTIMCWGFDDSHSWLGNPCNCQMWDAQGKPKADVVAVVEDLFNKCDPAIIEKRKQFMGATSIQLQKGSWKPVSPAHPRVTLNDNSFSYILEVPQDVHLQVLDAQGRSVLEINCGMQSVGTHCVRLPNGRLPAGIYFAKIKVNDNYIVAKIAKAI